MPSSTTKQRELLLYCKVHNIPPPVYYHDFDERGRWLCEVVVGGKAFAAGKPTDTVAEVKEHAAEVALKVLTAVKDATPEVATPPVTVLSSSTPSSTFPFAPAVSSTTNSASAGVRPIPSAPSPAPATITTANATAPASATEPAKYSTVELGSDVVLLRDKLFASLAQVQKVFEKCATPLDRASSGNEKSRTEFESEREPLIKTDACEIIEPTVAPKQSSSRPSELQAQHLNPDNISNLHLLCQLRGWEPDYQYVGNGPFTVSLSIPAIGIFKVDKWFPSKRAAKAHICWEALRTIYRDLPTSSTSHPTSRPASASGKSIASTEHEKTAIGLFHEQCQRRGWEKPNYDCSMSKAGWTGFLVFQDKKYSVGNSMTSKSMVKMELAKMVMADVGLEWRSNKR